MQRVSLEIQRFMGENDKENGVLGRPRKSVHHLRQQIYRIRLVAIRADFQNEK